MFFLQWEEARVPEENARIQGENIQSPHRKAPVGIWTRNPLAMRQQWQPCKRIQFMIGHNKCSYCSYRCVSLKFTCDFDKQIFSSSQLLNSFENLCPFPLTVKQPFSTRLTVKQYGVSHWIRSYLGQLRDERFGTGTLRHSFFYDTIFSRVVMYITLEAAECHNFSLIHIHLFILLLTE